MKKLNLLKYQWNTFPMKHNETLDCSWLRNLSACCFHLLPFHCFDRSSCLREGHRPRAVGSSSIYANLLLQCQPTNHRNLKQTWTITPSAWLGYGPIRNKVATRCYTATRSLLRTYATASGTGWLTRQNDKQKGGKRKKENERNRKLRRIVKDIAFPRNEDLRCAQSGSDLNSAVAVLKIWAARFRPSPKDPDAHRVWLQQTGRQQEKQWL